MRIFFKTKNSPLIINIGSKTEMSIKDYAREIRNKIDKKVKILFDKNKKIDGVNRKKLDTNLAKINGWESKMHFRDAIDRTIKDFKKIINRNLFLNYDYFRIIDFSDKHNFLSFSFTGFGSLISFELNRNFFEEIFLGFVIVALVITSHTFF